jgi:hypothetical protein
MLTKNLALISLVEGHDPSDVARVAAALQRQATRDFGPIWEASATVDAFPRVEDMPVGYWPMFVLADIGKEGIAGIHLDNEGQPFALITYSDSWSMTASHEMLEMLADPAGNRLVPGPSPQPDQGRVEFLLEVCDPSEAAKFGYRVNDILVSDFYTPRFFDPVPVDGARYSFTGAIKQPRQVLPGGYITWHEPISNHLWQLFAHDSDVEIVDQGPLDPNAKSLRVEVDRMTPHPQLDQGLDSSDETLAAAVSAGEHTEAAAAARATRLQAQIDALLAA